MIASGYRPRRCVHTVRYVALVSVSLNHTSHMYCPSASAPPPLSRYVPPRRRPHIIKNVKKHRCGKCVSFSRPPAAIYLRTSATGRSSGVRGRRQTEATLEYDNTEMCGYACYRSSKFSFPSQNHVQRLSVIAHHSFLAAQLWGLASGAG